MPHFALMSNLAPITMSASMVQYAIRSSVCTVYYFLICQCKYHCLRLSKVREALAVTLVSLFSVCFEGEAITLGNGGVSSPPMGKWPGLGSTVAGSLP